MKKFLFLAMATLPLVFISCSKDNEIPENTENTENPDEELIIKELPKIDNISLDYHPSNQIVNLPRDVESEGASISLKYDSYWITQLKLDKNYS